MNLKPRNNKRAKAHKALISAGIFQIIYILYLGKVTLLLFVQHVNLCSCIRTAFWPFRCEIWGFKTMEFTKTTFLIYIDLSSITVLSTVEFECPVFFIYIESCKVWYFYFKLQHFWNCLITINSGTAHGDLHICHWQCCNGIRNQEYSFRLVFLWISFL